MTRREFDYSSQFEEVVSYPDFSLSPANVAVNTSRVLDFYFNSGITNLEPVRDYLRDITLPFLRNAQKGLLYNIQAVDKLGLISQHDLKMVMERRQRFGEEELNPLEHEAFDYTLVTFSALPELARHSLVPTGFSTRGLLAPPATVRQFLGRIDEMGGQIAQLAGGVVDSGEIIEKNPALWRTNLFFEVAGELPLFCEDNPKIVEQAARDSFNKLLDGVNI